MMIIKTVHGYHEINPGNQEIYPHISNYFSLSQHLRGLVHLIWLLKIVDDVSKT